MQLKISLIRMLQQFKFAVPAHAAVNARVMSTMLFPDGRVPLAIEKQDGRFTANPCRGNILRFVTLPDQAAPDQAAAAARKAA
jgi:hypothetical protein